MFLGGMISGGRVAWALERQCVFRQGDNWLPEDSRDPLFNIRRVSSAMIDDRVVDGVCVMAWTVTNKDDSGNNFDAPSYGFRIEDRLGKFGGYSGALGECENCEANVGTAEDFLAAGCFGYLEVWPGCDDLNEEIGQAIAKLNLEREFQDAFLVTSPFWFGFWIDSPLTRQQVEILYRILSLVWSENSPDKSVEHFLDALKAAIEHDLNLHVKLEPTGHPSCGCVQIDPHCPRCKATSTQSWRENKFFECTVCGLVDNEVPRMTYVYDEPYENGCLKHQLGAEGYKEFIGQYLRHQGCSEQHVVEVLQDMESRKWL